MAYRPIRDPYEVVLDDLRAKRDEIDKLIRSLEAFRPSTQTTSVVQALVGVMTVSSASAVPPPPQPLLGMTIVDAARAVLKGEGRPLANFDLADALTKGGLAMNSADPVNTISSVLTRYYNQGGDIVRAGRGVWDLAERRPELRKIAEGQPSMAKGLLANLDRAIAENGPESGGDIEPSNWE